jgi:arylsulfatase A-like enzyme
MIISGAPLSKYKMQGNTYEDALTYVMDITPTILELTHVKHPGNRYGGRRIAAMGGRSLLPLLSGKSEHVYGPEETIGYEVAGNKALFQGDYKIMYNMGPVGDDQWHLYNIAADPGESQDLKNSRPEHFDKMKVLYAQYAKLHHIQTLPAGYNQQRQVGLNGVKKIIGTEIFTLMLTLLVVLGFYLIYRFKKNSFNARQT